MQAVTQIEINVTATVNTQFAPMETGELADYLGDVTASIIDSSNSSTLATDEVEVSTAAQESGLIASSLTLDEYLPESNILTYAPTYTTADTTLDKYNPYTDATELLYSSMRGFTQTTASWDSTYTSYYEGSTDNILMVYRRI